MCSDTARNALLPAAIARRVLKLLEDLAYPEKGLGDAVGQSPRELLGLALQQPRLTFHVIDAVLQERAAAMIAAHLQDAVWARAYPLTVQEYSPVFAKRPMLHAGLLGALQESPWPRDALQQLRQAIVDRTTDVAQQAQALLAEFATIAAEAATLLQRLSELRAIKAASPMHVVQIEAFLAATLCCGPLAGMSCCDLGSGEGELVEYLQQCGARACGTELALSHSSLLGVDEEPRFDVVFATAFMEPGAYSWPGIGVSLMTYDNRADELVLAAARLLNPQGLLVVRNVNHPLPFSRGALQDAGLVHERVLVPLCTPMFGGRMGVWRKQPAS